MVTRNSNIIVVFLLIVAHASVFAIEDSWLLAIGVTAAVPFFIMGKNININPDDIWTVRAHELARYGGIWCVFPFCAIIGFISLFNAACTLISFGMVVAIDRRISGIQSSSNKWE